MKDDEVRFRVASEVKAALQRAAAKDGLDLSAWLRRLAMKAAGLLNAK